MMKLSWMYIAMFCISLDLHTTQLVPSTSPSKTPVTIGVIFEANGDALEEVLKFTLAHVNAREMLGRDVYLTYIVNKTTSLTDAFEVFHMGCSQASQGIMAYIGPLTSYMVSTLAPLAASMNLPLIAPFATSPLLAQATNYPYVVRLAPPDSVQGLALVDLVEHFGWRRLAILTSDDNYGVHGLVTFAAEAAHRGVKILSVQVFHPTDKVKHIDVTRQLSLIRQLGVRVVVLHCLSRYGFRVLDQAAGFNMTGRGWAWVVTDGLSTTSRKDPKTDVLVGAVGVRPAIGRGKRIESMTVNWRIHNEAAVSLEALHTRVMDAVLTFVFGYRNMRRNLAENVTAEPLDCLSGTKWQYGKSLMENILKVDEDGVSLRLQFDDNHSPSDVSYEYVNLQQNGWTKIGEWSKDTGATIHHPVLLHGGTESVNDAPRHLPDRHLRVVIINEPPFVIVSKPAYNQTLPASRVSGFCMDLLGKLSELNDFTFSLYLVPDGLYGARNDYTGQWNGLVRELVQRSADLAVGPFTITNVRERDIDFTRPFLDYGIGIIMQMPPPEPWDPFKFTRPFTSELWYYILGTTLVIGLFICLLNKLSPYEIHGQFVYNDEPYQRPVALRSLRLYRAYRKEKTEATNILSLGNCLWFSIASLLHQGAEHYPRALSSRISVTLWWMGVVILIATYTANLAAHLTSNRSVEAIESAEDLARQSKVLYGTVGHSSVYQFLSDSEVPLYSDMVTFMRQRNTIVANSSVGLDMARRGGYAFLWDSAVLEYAVRQPPCRTLKTFGRTFGRSGYGFGLQKNSLFNAELSQSILNLREIGYIEMLTNKWYSQNVRCTTSQEEEFKTKLNQKHRLADTKSGFAFRKLEIDGKIQGVFLIVWIGCGAGFLILILECLVSSLSLIDKKNKKMPNTFTESFKYHCKTLKLNLLKSISNKKQEEKGCAKHNKLRVTLNRSHSYPQPKVRNRIQNGFPIVAEAMMKNKNLPRNRHSYQNQLTARQLPYLPTSLGAPEGNQSRSQQGSHSEREVASEVSTEHSDNWIFRPHTNGCSPSPAIISSGPYNV